MNVFEKMNIDIWIFVNSDKELYQQIFLEELKNSIKKKKVIYTINEELRLDKFFIFHGFNIACYVLVIYH